MSSTNYFIHAIKGRYCYQLRGTKLQIDKAYTHDKERAKVDKCKIAKGNCTIVGYDRKHSHVQVYKNMVASKWGKDKTAAADQVSTLNLLDETNFGTFWYQGAMELGN